MASQNFNLHHLRKISTGFKMTLSTPKSGILYNSEVVNLEFHHRSEDISQTFIYDSADKEKNKQFSITIKIN